MATTKLFVGGLAWKTSTEDLRSHFEQFGEVTDAEVILDREANRSRGFGFVTFGSEADAKKAVDETNNQDLDGRRIRVDFAGQQRSGSRGGFQGGENSFRERSGGRFGGGGRRGGGSDQRSGRSNEEYRGSSYRSERSSGRSDHNREY